MSNDGSATPEPGEQPSSTGRPGTDGDEQSTPTAPAPSGYEAARGAGPAPSGFEVPTLAPSDDPVTAPYGTTPAPPAPQPPSADWPTAPFGTRAAGDQPTAAYGTPSADQPTSPYGVPPVQGTPGGYGAPATTPYGTPAASTGEQPAAPSGDPATGGHPAPGGYGEPGGAYAAPGYPQQGYPQQGQPQQGYLQQPGAGYPPAGGGYPPAGGGYPPAGGGPYPYGAAPYPGPQASTTDGVAIAALVTSLLGMNVVAVVLGILGLRRTKKNGTQGRGLALAGLVLGAIELVALVVIGIAIAVAVTTHGNQMDALREDCGSGVMQACDDLYYDSPVGSDDEEFGRTCGGRTDGLASCTALDTESGTDDGGTDGVDPDTQGADPGTEGGDPGVVGGSYGSDPGLDALWDACEAGSGSACDDLYYGSPAGSEYEDYGTTCGNRVDFAMFCEDEIGG